jgi:hypothetical protein
MDEPDREMSSEVREDLGLKTKERSENKPRPPDTSICPVGPRTSLPTFNPERDVKV